MKPKIFRVPVGSNFDLNDSDQQYVVDFLLDCTIAVVETRDTKGIYESEKAKCEAIISEIFSLLKSITTEPQHKLKMYVTIDISQICEAIVDRVAFFSDKTKERSRKLLKKHLRAYL